MILGIAALMISGATPFFVSWLGSVRYVFTATQLAAPLLLLWSAFLYRRRLGPPLVRGALGLKLLLLVLTLVSLSFYGRFRDNPVDWVVRDCWPYAVILAGLLLGRFDRAMEDLEKPLLVAFWVCFVFTVATLDTALILSAGFFERVAPLVGERSSVDTVGYKVGDTLGFWPLVFILGYLRPRMDFWKMLSIAAALGWIGLQIHFQKRAPFARGMVYVAIAVAIIPFLQKRLKLGTALLFLLAIISFLLVMQRGVSFQRLMVRYEEDPSLFESSRYMEARSMLDDLHGAEWLYGKGMGGGFQSPWSWSVRRLEDPDASMTLHVGLLMPLLKGGLFLSIIFYAFFFPLFTRKPPGWYGSRWNVAAMAIAPVVLVFLLAEGGALTGSTMDPLMVGIILARGATADQPQVEYPPGAFLSEEEYEAYGPIGRTAL
jgi:hypothetical protein